MEIHPNGHHIIEKGIYKPNLLLASFNAKENIHDLINFATSIDVWKIHIYLW